MPLTIQPRPHWSAPADHTAYTVHSERSGVGPTLRPSRGPALRLGILGQLQIAVDGVEIPLPQAKLRVLLATLVVRENKVVSVDTLIRELWNERPPPTALRALRVHISQLRKFLARLPIREVECRLVTQAPGYRLLLADGVLDLLLFEQYCDLARAAAPTEPELAVRHYRRALALSRGPALADVRAESPALEAVALWLDEARLTALIRCVDLDMHLGRHMEVLSELTALAADHPLNEGLHSRLMIALYRCGRLSDALGVYRSIRALMVNELGTEPGHEIRRIQQAVLARQSIPPDALTLGMAS